MSRKQRTTIRRKNYRAWKQEQKTQSNAPAVAQSIEDHSSAPAQIDHLALLQQLRSLEVDSDEDLASDLDLEASEPAPIAPGHSTGPRTAAGLARSSQNARKHGLSSLTSVFVMMSGEDPHEWVQLVDDLNQEFQPASRSERILVNDMAQSHWLTQRAINLQTSHIEDPKFFALYLRYQTTHHRAYYRALKQLLTLQKVREHSTSKAVTFYPEVTTDHIVIDPQPARSGAGMPTSGSSNTETSQPQAA
jgi:hypothetical protein